MNRFLVALAAVATGTVSLAGAILSSATEESFDSTSIFGGNPPPRYRDWKLVCVAYEEGGLGDTGPIPGNDVTIRAYRDAGLPFPDGAIITQLAWDYDHLPEDNRAFSHFPRAYETGLRPLVLPSIGNRASNNCSNSGDVP